MNDELYRQFLANYETDQRLVIERGDAKEGLYALGFKDVVNFDGVDLTYEYGVPPQLAYGIPFEQMEIMSLQPTMFAPEGPDFDIASQSYRFSIDFFGNMKVNPRYWTKWMAGT
jgi:hypothetical protein